MAGFSTTTTENLTRTQLWSAQLKDVLLEDLFATKYVRYITDFPDGTTLNVPSIGLLETRDYAENQPIEFTSMSTGNWEFTVNKYKSVGTYITDKEKLDSYYSSQLISTFVPRMHRAFAKKMEVDFLATAASDQTSDDTNSINGAAHRFIGNGTNETIAIKDFELANYALNMANVPFKNRIAIVHPSVAFSLATMTNIINVSNNPSWQGIIRDGFNSDVQFYMNVFGFDVYISQNLSVNSASETIGGKTAAAGVNNLFFSASSDILPIHGLIRQPPKVEFFRNSNLQRDEYVATCYYDYKTFWPDNMVIVVTDTDQVA